jgi:hypothetical protein
MDHNGFAEVECQMAEYILRTDQFQAIGFDYPVENHK